MRVDLMSIGEFARRSRLSPKALRLYDELDLLEPTRVDDGSGYCYYSASRPRPSTRLAVTSPVTSSTMCKERGMPCMKSPHGTSLREAFCRSNAASKELTQPGRSAKSSSRSCAATSYRGWMNAREPSIASGGARSAMTVTGPGVVSARAGRPGGAACHPGPGANASR